MAGVVIRRLGVGMLPPPPPPLLNGIEEKKEEEKKRGIASSLHPLRMLLNEGFHHRPPATTRATGSICLFSRPFIFSSSLCGRLLHAVSSTSVSRWCKASNKTAPEREMSCLFAQTKWSFFGGRWVFRMGEVFLPAAKPAGQGTESVVLLPVVVGVTTFILLP